MTLKKYTFISFALLAVMLLQSCQTAPPRNTNNACSIFNEKSSWRKHSKKVERKWGVPASTLLAIMHQESRFKSDAKTPKKKGWFTWGRVSSAYGYSQALDGTWDNYRKATGHRFASRSNFGDAADFMGWYMNETKQKTGISLRDTYGQYLAYHEGQGGYNRRTYLSKPWLLKVARKVNLRAGRYRYQLSSCR